MNEEIASEPIRLNPSTLDVVGAALSNLQRSLNLAEQVARARVRRFNRTYRGAARTSPGLNARSISAKVREDTRRVRRGLAVSTAPVPVLPEGITRPVSRSAAHLRASLTVVEVSTPEDVSAALRAAQPLVWEAMVRREITKTWRTGADAAAWEESHDPDTVTDFIREAAPDGDFAFDWLGAAAATAHETISRFWDIYHEAAHDSAVPTSTAAQIAERLGNL